jgi:calcineurin-like phosphoesterase family protein
MSRVYIISDTHLGHNAICKYRTEFSTAEEHNHHILEEWNSVVTRRDTVYLLGDAVFSMDAMLCAKQLNGNKILVRGNHDKLDTHVYLTAFKHIYGVIKYKGIWLSHAPIHPQELRGCYNIHGHVHNETIPDSRYFNACIENIGYKPILFTDIVDILNKRVHDE